MDFDSAYLHERNKSLRTSESFFSVCLLYASTGTLQLLNGVLPEFEFEIHGELELSSNGL